VTSLLWTAGVGREVWLRWRRAGRKGQDPISNLGREGEDRRREELEEEEEERGV
jgi:hypothetical protein